MSVSLADFFISKSTDRNKKILTAISVSIFYLLKIAKSCWVKPIKGSKFPDKISASVKLPWSSVSISSSSNKEISSTCAGIFLLTERICPCNSTGAAGFFSLSDLSFLSVTSSFFVSFSSYSIMIMEIRTEAKKAKN